MSDKKIFEEYTPVDCNDCESYWNDSCDGVPEGVERRCTAFKATRRVVLPSRIEAVEKAVEGLHSDFKFSVVMSGFALLLVLVIAIVVAL